MEQRSHFTRATVHELACQNYNAVIVAGRWNAMGYALKLAIPFEGHIYTPFAAPRDRVMIVENCGDGGWESWALEGGDWVS